MHTRFPKTLFIAGARYVRLQKLLQHPELINSQLLADFLSPHSMGSQFLDKMLPDVNLGTVWTGLGEYVRMGLMRRNASMLKMHE